MRAVRDGRLLSASIFLVLSVTLAGATENGTSAYPVGVETVMPGKMPGIGDTELMFFNNFYQANQLAGANGRFAIPGFHLRVEAIALKMVHNSGFGVLGGRLVSSVALPLVYEHVDGPFGKGIKNGMANPDIGVALAYHVGDLHWWYGFDVYTPAPGYNKNGLANVSQHYFSTAPQLAFTYLPDHGKTEVSSKFQYLTNYADGSTHYHSGSEFVWEYAAMRKVTEKLLIGPLGYYYQQTSDDLQFGVPFADGNRGRVLALGPQVRYSLGHVPVVLKYAREMLAQNRAYGNSFWLEVGIPLGEEK